MTGPYSTELTVCKEMNYDEFLDIKSKQPDRIIKAEVVKSTGSATDAVNNYLGSATSRIRVFLKSKSAQNRSASKSEKDKS